MLLGKIIQKVGARRRVEIDYSDFLIEGEWLTGVACTIDQGEATVDTVTMTPDAKKVSFFLDGGTLNDVFNIIIEATTNITARRYDTVQVLVETNGGATIIAGQTALMLSIVGPTGPTGPTGP